MDFPEQLKAPKFLQEHYSQIICQEKFRSNNKPKIISQEKKEPQVQCELRALRENGGDLLSRGCAVPSARLCLTSLFGMGRGGTTVL